MSGPAIPAIFATPHSKPTHTIQFPTNHKLWCAKRQKIACSSSIPGQNADAHNRATINNLESLASLDLDDLALPVEPSTITTKPEDTGTSKRLLIGRLATLGLGAVLLAERVTGQGAVQYITEKGQTVSLEHINPVIAMLIAALALAAMAPSNRQRLEDAKEQLLERLQAWWGRAACFSLAGVLSTELVTGEAVLELLNVETGVNTLSEPEAVGAFLLLLLLTGRSRRHV